MKNPKNFLSTYFNSTHANESLVASSFSEFNQTIGQSKQREVSSNAYILAGMVLRTPLTNDDISCDCRLTSIDLNSQALALRVPTVLYATFTFFVSHILEFEMPPKAAFILYAISFRLRDLINTDLRIMSTMTMFLAETFPSFHFEGDDLVTLHVVENLGLDDGLDIFTYG